MADMNDPAYNDIHALVAAYEGLKGEKMIYGALLEVMDNVRAIRKDGRNTSQNFNFRGIDAVLNATGPEFRKAGVIPTSRILNVEHRDITTGKGSIMRETVLQVEYTFHAKDGSSISTQVVAESADSGDKGSTKAMSVALRTAILQILAMPTDEPDPDETTITRAEFNPDTQARALGWTSAQAQREAWDACVGRTKAAGDSMKEWARNRAFRASTLTPEQHDEWDGVLDQHEDAALEAPM
jgi:ERF superfamily